MRYKILYDCITHTGRVRSVNQDNFACFGRYMHAGNAGQTFPLQGICHSDDTPLFGVFDGMGGEQFGEEASYLAARQGAKLETGRDCKKALLRLCRDANLEICDFAETNHINSMGTTAAMLVFQGRHAHICNIGDSKVFRLRDGILEQLSKDHLCIAAYGMKPALSQSLGIPPEKMRLDPFYRREDCRDGDLYLICSDGLTDMLTHEEIQAVLASASGSSAIVRLLEMALANGGKDNTTIILCKVEKERSGLFRN